MDNRIEQLRTYLKDDPEDAFLLFALAQEQVKAGEWETARDTYHQLHRLHPDYVGLYYHLGMLEQHTGNVESARSVFREGIQQAAKANDHKAVSELQAALDNLSSE